MVRNSQKKDLSKGESFFNEICSYGVCEKICCERA